YGHPLKNFRFILLQIQSLPFHKKTSRRFRRRVQRSHIPVLKTVYHKIPGLLSRWKDGILILNSRESGGLRGKGIDRFFHPTHRQPPPIRSEEHTSELQSRFDLVCR